MLSKTYKIELSSSQKLTINIIFISIIILINIYIYFNFKKNSLFYKELYADFLKYLCIEFGLVISHAIQNGEFNFTGSLTRISIILLALFIYHEIKVISNL